MTLHIFETPNLLLLLCCEIAILILVQAMHRSSRLSSAANSASTRSAVQLPVPAARTPEQQTADTTAPLSQELAEEMHISLWMGICLLTVTASAASLSGDVQVIKQRFLLQVWPAVSAVSGVAAAAQQEATALNASCYWPDINYEDQNRAVWPAINHLDRVNTMVQALTAPYSPLFNDTGLQTATVCALNVWLVRQFTNPNWWYAAIGTPTLIGNIFVMLGIESLTQQQVDAGVFLMLQAAWWILPFGEATGANLVWELQVEIARGLSTNNETAITEAFSHAWSGITVVDTSLEGIQVDSAYYFHGPQLLSGSYGCEGAQDLLQFWVLANGTAYDCPQPTKDLFASWMVDGDAWMSVRGVFDFGVVGRSVARTGVLTVVPSGEQLASFAPYTNRTSDLLAYAARINGEFGAPLLLGNKHFWTSDYQVHRRPGWTAAFRMHSIRTTASECDNGENLKGEHLADGVLNVYGGDDNPTAGSEYRLIFPLLDWNAIGGITVEHTTPLLPCNAGTGDTFDIRKTSFVGGVSDSAYGAAAMDTATHNLTAQRSLFFWDEGVVAVATNITDPTDADIWTTIVARMLVGNASVAFRNGTVIRLEDGNYTFPAVEVAWIWADGTAWVPLFDASIADSGVTIGVSAWNRTGTWQAIGAYNGTAWGRVLQVNIVHGACNHAPSSYAYAVLPNVTLAAAQETLAGTNISVSTSTALAHVAVNAALQRMHAVVWAPQQTVASCGASAESCVWNLTAHSTAPVLLLLSEEESLGALTVTASNPDQLGLAVNVTVSRALVGKGCFPGRDVAHTIFTLQLAADVDNLGKSVSRTCQPA